MFGDFFPKPSLFTHFWFPLAVVAAVFLIGILEVADGVGIICFTFALTGILEVCDKAG